MHEQTTQAPILVCDRERTAALLDFRPLVDSIARAALEMEQGAIASPERMVIPLGDGGVMLSMPATARDVGIHKLVNVQPANVRRQLPTINGTVTVCDAATGSIVCLLDGPEVTGRRTAAVTLLAIRTFLKTAPDTFLLFGTGAQTRYHVQAINAIYPNAQIFIRGRDLRGAAEFCERHRDLHPRLEPVGAVVPQVEVVITLTTSTEPVYEELAQPGRLVIGVGAFKPEMAEIGKATLVNSLVYADEPAGARHEAGDLLRAGVDWAQVRSLAYALKHGVDHSRPVVFKSVGTAAWDLAAARVALVALSAN
jgi:1-piperideine-2-carboxylate/1-pyrroline-2-carboxylate reductase [NAD(P)H]